MELKKLAIALLALYIVYCFMSKEKYAFDEPEKLQFPADAEYIDIYHKKDKDKNGRETIVLNKVTYSANIAPEKNGTTKADGNVATITNFTSKVPKSILLYGVNYDNDKKVKYYRPIDNKNSTEVQVEMRPGKEIIFKNLTPGTVGASFGGSNFTKDDIIHTGRFVFTF